jgi:hypothetical protein
VEIKYILEQLITLLLPELLIVRFDESGILERDAGEEMAKSLD